MSKRKKAFGWFTKLDAGNVPVNNAIFNSGIGAQGTGQAMGEGYVEEPIDGWLNVDTLYHATYEPYLDEIKKSGFIKPGIHKFWGISDTSYIYLSKDYDNAISYAKEADNVPEAYLDQIVVLEIDPTKLDLDNLNADANQVYDYEEKLIEDPDTWIELQYEGEIPVSAIKRVIKPGLAEEKDIIEELKEEYAEDNGLYTEEELNSDTFMDDVQEDCNIWSALNKVD